METISLKDYLESLPVEKDINISTQRSCHICHKFGHYKNMAFIMAVRIKGYGSTNYIFCPSCLPHWEKAFRVGRVTSIDEWHFSTWNIDKPFPHTEADRVFLAIINGQLYLQADYNPSKRKSRMIVGEFL